MIFRGLDLAYKAFRRARFNKNDGLESVLGSTSPSGNLQNVLKSLYNSTPNAGSMISVTPNNITLTGNYITDWTNFTNTSKYMNASNEDKIAMYNAWNNNYTVNPETGRMVLKEGLAGTNYNLGDTYALKSFNNQEGFLGLTNGTWQGIGAGLNLANFGLNGILGYLNYRTAKKAMEQQNAYNHATYAANAKAYNTKLRSGNYIGRALAGDNYTDEMRKADDAGLKEAQVSETY